MSGSHLVEQSPEVSPATNATTEDQAASLRAAALLTLKSKRRRLTADSSQPVLPPRPTVAPPSITLDYGTEEPSGGVSSTASSPAMQPVTSAPPVPDQMDVVDEQAREEGEISDSDSPPPSPIMQPQPDPPSPKVAQSEQASVRMPPPPPPALKLEPMSPALSSAAPQSATRTVASAPSEQRFYRPGLASESCAFAEHALSNGVSSDRRTVQRCKRHHFRPTWLGCSSRVPSQLWPES